MLGGEVLVLIMYSILIKCINKIDIRFLTAVPFLSGGAVPDRPPPPQQWRARGGGEGARGEHDHFHRRGGLRRELAYAPRETVDQTARITHTRLM
jgi:hypothetical protein